MTFEQQITEAFETLSERLRGEIDREVERRTAEWSAAQAASHVDVVAAAAPQADGDGAALERLARGFDAVDAAGSLTAILDALLAYAGEDAPDASVWLIRGGRPHRWRAAGAGDDVDAAPARSLDEGIPLAISGQTVAVLLADSEPRTANSEPTTQNLELVARYASRSLEALTAFATARALTHHASADSGSRPSTGSGRREAPDGGNAEDDQRSEGETSARRYARLLVSEIRLYHEPAVIAGRRDRDLASRLGGEITRARVMYEQRVPPDVRERHDYFHEELVRTLANGDSSLIGS